MYCRHRSSDVYYQTITLSLSLTFFFEYTFNQSTNQPINEKVFPFQLRFRHTLPMPFFFCVYILPSEMIKNLKTKPTKRRAENMDCFICGLIDVLPFIVSSKIVYKCVVNDV